MPSHSRRRISEKARRRITMRNLLTIEEKERLANAINDYMTFNFDFGLEDPSNPYRYITRTGRILDDYIQTHTKEFLIRELAGAYLNYLIGEEGDDRGVFTFVADDEVETNVLPIISRMLEEMLIEKIPLTTGNMNHKLASTFDTPALRRYLLPQTVVNHEYRYEGMGPGSMTSSLSSVHSRSHSLYDSHRPRSRTRTSTTRRRARAPSRKRSRTFRFRPRPRNGAYNSNSESSNNE